ncbi:hypothetical protein ARMGADRAFT_1080636 [Armillaria gallica]|uniref:Uncharacterized protein n=1 Tax=Armillaria gallica TaxID=47427 RepID=A0A2H3DBG9_ARMGA|nr:hypothetical protein ARMGADRAFT_1080636 [Armillaria gallica]
MDKPEFWDLHPNFELPDTPMELNPVPSYEVRDPCELPRARPRPLQPRERNSVPFPMMTGTNRPFIFSFGAGLPEDPDSDTSNKPRPSQQRRLSDLASKSNPFADPHPFCPDDNPFNPNGTSTEKSSDLTEAPPGKSDDETSSSGSSGPTVGILESEWTSTWPPRAAIHSWESTRTPDWPRGYTPTTPRASTHPTPARDSHTHAPGLPANRWSSRPTSAPWHTSMRNGPKSRGFELDEETFGVAIRDDDATLDWNMVGPMSDSPPRRNRQRRDQYHGKGTSVLIAGAGGDKQMGGGGGQPAQPRPQNLQELAEHYAAALQQITQMRDTENELRDQLTVAQNVDRGRQPGRQPDLDRYSVARPPAWTGPPGVRPTGSWDTDNPPAAAEIKPILMEKPWKFVGKHDDIERFIGDCITYFEVF